MFEPGHSRKIDLTRSLFRQPTIVTTTKELTNMSKADENVEVVRRGYQAFNTGDVKALTELFDPKASWHTPGRSPIAGDHQGRDAVFAQFGRYGGDTAGTFKATLQDVLKSDDGRVIGIHHNSAQRNGKRLDVGCCIVFEVKDGRIVDGREHFYDLHNWDQFWS
jgi:ketosteroid isomerase-like protein